MPENARDSVRKLKTNELAAMADPLWRPSAADLSQSNMARFMRAASAGTGDALTTFEDLHSYSVQDPEGFWVRLWDQCGVVGDKGAAPHLIDSDKMPGARFFPSASLSFAENLLAKPGAGAAMVFWGEDKVRRTVDWADLPGLVSQVQAVLAAAGVASGDRVAAMMPNVPETIVAMLGANSLGAVWSSCSPDFGAKGVLDRFGQIAPKVLIACDGYYYNGAVIRIADKLREVLSALPSVELVLIVDYVGEAADVANGIERASDWTGALAKHAPRAPRFERLAFSHPLYILFSSGTTGAPKCLLHSAGGTLLQHLKEHVLHCDLRPDERLFYFTTCGWMMWNWLASGLASGATLLLYDGSPFARSGTILFDYADEERMSVFGTSAKYIDAVRKAGLRPRETHSLASVRMMTSTGSPLAPESFDFIYQSIKPGVHLASISGGTDIVSCFVLGTPLKPVYKGEIQGPGLGMAVDVFDDRGESMASGRGELVCTRPFPSLPIGFWNDPDGSRYHEAYFARFPDIWCHGDYAEWTEHGGMVIHGRSDATLNPGGVRIGTAEIYAQVEQLDEVIESVAIGQDWDNDVRVVLFVVLATGAVLDDTLKERICKRIRQGASPRHVPARIVSVPDIPRTRSGKITELAVRDVVHGREVKNTEALANPEALERFRDLPESKL